MKVFISWSGEASHEASLVLREWLPSVVQFVEPYVSSADIDKGSRWATDVAGELDQSNFGIICVTKENIKTPWINLEAGALSKSVEKSRVCPLLLGAERSDIINIPLSQFQSALCTKDEIRKLIESINQTKGDGKLDNEKLTKIFDVWWPLLDEKLTIILNRETVKPGRARSTQSEDPTQKKLEEIIGVLQQNSLVLNNPNTLLPMGYLKEVFDISRRKDSIDGHPVFDDLIDIWINLCSVIEQEKMEISDTLRAEMQRMERPLLYISDRFGGSRRLHSRLLRNRKAGEGR